MCFSNLPVEFDEHGDPYLTEAAEDVNRPACDCAEGEVSLAEDPTEAYEAVLRTVSPEVRELLENEAVPTGEEATVRGD